MKVQTKVGEIETGELEQVSERAKFWAGAMVDLIRVDELYCVMDAALKEAFSAGMDHGFVRVLEGLGEINEVAQGDREELRNPRELEGAAEGAKGSGEGAGLGAVHQADGAGV